MLIDDVTVTVKAGKGGNGAVTFHPMRGGPSGGNGGKGGNIYLIGVNDLNALSQFQFKKQIQAQDGEPGGRQDKDGHDAEDLYIKIPIGTRFAINDSDWLYEIEDTETPFLLAEGGRGGRGNDEFKTSTNQTPYYAQKGRFGQEKKIRLQLRLIAQIGFVGLPNAGKSSMLQALTNATPKIANYPFTTLEPNLGVLVAGEEHLILADIPGLIEGASTGRGLGIKFLKHIEKTKLLAHCIDCTNENIVETYNTVRNEFKQYNPELLEKPELILLTKTDLIDAKEVNRIIKTLKKLKSQIIPVSVIDDESMKNLTKILTEQVKATRHIVRAKSRTNGLT